MLKFKQFIQERVLSIGINATHEANREIHRHEIHGILHKSYASIGGYGGLGSGSKEETDAIHSDISNSLIKATKREGKITAVHLYKDRHGRKMIAAGTDGSDQGKKDFVKTGLEDHGQKRSWGEVSGKMEHIAKKIGNPVIPNHMAAKLTGKEVKPHEDGEHYDRDIGGHSHTKLIIGHPKFKD